MIIPAKINQKNESTAIAPHMQIKTTGITLLHIMLRSLYVLFVSYIHNNKRLPRKSFKHKTKWYGILHEVRTKPHGIITV